jgi:uncharacterized membrane protein
MMRGRWTVVALAFVAAGAAVGIWGYSVLPAGARIEVHFNAAGVANGWADKVEGLFLLPAISAVTIAILILAPAILPRARNPVTMAGPYGIVVGGVAGVLFASQAALVAHAIDPSFDVLRATFLASGALLIVVGNYLGKVRQNWLLGVRTPWTLTNETVWDKTHRFTGRLMFAAGVLLIPTSAFIPDHRWLIAAMVICAAGPILAGAVYSAVIFPRARQA